MASDNGANGVASQIRGTDEKPESQPDSPPSAAGALFRLDGRTVIGGVGGIGVYIAQAILEQGGDVACLDMALKPPEPQWTKLSTTASKHNGKLSYSQCDVTSPDQVTAVFEHVDLDSRHPLRGLVACAGISGRCDALDYPIDAFKRIMDVNVTGTFLCARAAAGIMRSRDVAGSIVMLASMSGTNVNQGVATAAYSASKSAVLQLGRSLAAEWGGDNAPHPPIRVNTLSPGYIETPITLPTMEELPELKELWPNGNMLRRLSKPEEFRGPVLFLLGDASSYVTGSDLRADAGHTAW